MPPGPAWPALLRLSLGTTDSKMARYSLCKTLIWLMPFRDAETVRRQAEEILAQCREFTRKGQACDWQEIDDRQRFFATFAEFASEVRHYNVPDVTRLGLIEEWSFFAEMLRQDRARLYGSTSKLAVSTEDGPSSRHEHAPEPTADPPVGVAASSTRLRGGRKTSSVLAEFLQEQRQSNGDDSAQHDVGIYVEFLIALLGDKALRAYTDDDFASLGRELANIPDRNGIPRERARTLWDRFEFARRNGWEGLKRLSETSLQNRYRTGLNRFLTWAKARKYLTEQIKISIVMSAENLVALPRDAFTDEEVRQILSMPTFTGHGLNEKWQSGSYLAQDHVYWGYIVMLLTGMRTSEVAQLRVEDIIDAEGWYFFNLQPFDPAKGRVPRKDLTKLKTENSTRSIPLDLLLIDLVH